MLAFLVLLFISPVLTIIGLPTSSIIPSSSTQTTPKTSSTCACPEIQKLEVLVCVLDWISHVRILSKETRRVNGTTFNQYTLEHIDTIKGGFSLPTVLIIPDDPCGLQLKVDSQYLLSGLLTGDSKLYATLCLQILNVLSPMWSLVTDSLFDQLGLLNTMDELVCDLLTSVVKPLVKSLSIPRFFNNFDHKFPIGAF